jgi:hypothetical protein
LPQFEATYHTRGDLTITTYSGDEGKIEAAVQSSRFGGTTAFISLTELAQFRKLVSDAKEKLDAVNGTKE